MNITFRKNIKLTVHLTANCGYFIIITFKVYSADVNTAQTHRVAMSLSTLDQVILDKTNFGVEGEIKDVQIPSNESYELCFDGR